MSTEKKEKKTIKTVISLEEAISDVRDFVYHHDDLLVGKLDEDDAVLDKYPNIVAAIQRGKLIIDENKSPILELSNPVGDVDKITFKTRIKPMDNSSISKGIDIGKNQGEYLFRVICHLAQQPKGIVNAFEKFDYKTVEQICTLFL